MKVACVHDWLTTYVGSERVVEGVLELFPDAPLYTLVYRPEAFAGTIFADRQIHTSFIERLPRGREKYRSYLALMPLAIEQFDLSAYDVVISSCHAVAKGVLTRADQLHISYIHTPIRYAWDLHFQYLREAKLERGLKSWVARAILHYVRQWDVLAANRVDVFVANSQYVASRIRKTYRREAWVRLTARNLLTEFLHHNHQLRNHFGIHQGLLHNRPTAIRVESNHGIRCNTASHAEQQTNEHQKTRKTGHGSLLEISPGRVDSSPPENHLGLFSDRTARPLSLRNTRCSDGRIGSGGVAGQGDVKTVVGLSFEKNER